MTNESLAKFACYHDLFIACLFSQFIKDSGRPKYFVLYFLNMSTIIPYTPSQLEGKSYDFYSIFHFTFFKLMKIGLKR